MHYRLIIVVILLVCLFSTTHTSAHLDAGEDIVKENYLIDLGFSPEMLYAHELVHIALNLVDNESQNIIEPDRVWVRISKYDEIIFSASLKPEAKHTLTSLTFADEGNYEMLVTFYNIEGKELISHIFELNVSNNKKNPHDEDTVSSKSNNMPVTGIAFASVVGFSLGLLCTKKKST